MSEHNERPAFPTDQYYDEVLIGQRSGMTLRDYFAAAALSVAAKEEPRGHEYESRLAESAYAIADAMLDAREV